MDISSYQVDQDALTLSFSVKYSDSMLNPLYTAFSLKSLNVDTLIVWGLIIDPESALNSVNTSPKSTEKRIVSFADIYLWSV